MKWNADTLAGFGLILTLCAGAANAQSIGAQAWSDPTPAPAPRQRGVAPLPQDQDQASETWRGADGKLRSRPRPAPVQPQAAPEQLQYDTQSTGPGAPYAVPGSAYPAPAPAPTRPQAQPPRIAPQPAPSYAPQQDIADPTAGMSGPRGSSQPGAGEQRYDEVGYAGVRGVAGGGAADEAVVAIHRSLPANTVVEVTSLDTGRNALVLITGTLEPGANRPIDLSAGAARQLGIAPGGSAPVRIRSVVSTPQDMLALRAGRAAAARPDAPQILLTALRKRVGAAPIASTAPSRPAPTRATPVRPAPARPVAAQPPARPAATGRYFVQVAALSSSPNAQSLARSLGGSVKAGGGLYRVQLGPFATQAEAASARARAARAGYGDARVFAVN